VAAIYTPYITARPCQRDPLDLIQSFNRYMTQLNYMYRSSADIYAGSGDIKGGCGAETERMDEEER
jgi:hypothetical protein